MSNVPATTGATVKKNVARICHFRRIRIAAISLSETVLPFSIGFMDPHLICRAACAGLASLGLEKRVRLACGPDRGTRVLTTSPSPDRKSVVYVDSGYCS